MIRRSDRIISKERQNEAAPSKAHICGRLASRRKSEELIKMGKVTVNGIPAALGDSADPDTDVICVDGKLLAKCEERTYIMLYKPRGYVTTLKDEKTGAA